MKRYRFFVFVVAVFLLTWAATSLAIAALPTPTVSGPGFFGADEPVIGGDQQNADVGLFRGGVGRPPKATVVSGPIPTPVVPTMEWLPDAAHEIQKELIIGPYVIRVWRNINSDSLLGFDSIVTVQAVGQPMVQIDMASDVHELTGTDITGEGNPDLIVETYSGGAHCCFSTIVYDLGPTLTEVLHTPESNCSGWFEDLDNDGVMEFITCDDRFAYEYCCFAGSPLVKVIMKYILDGGYVAASADFPEAYAEDIARHTAEAEKAVPGDFCEWDETTKCAVLSVVLDYLYSGQPDMAWSELARLYPYPDRDEFMQDILEAVDVDYLEFTGRAVTD